MIAIFCLNGFFLNLTGCDSSLFNQEIDVSKAVDVIDDEFNQQSLAWKPYEGNWQFKAGQLTQRASDEHFPIILREDKEIANLDISVNFKPISGEVDASGGIVFRAKNAGNYYVVRANALEHGLNLYVFNNWRRQLLASANVTRPELNKFHTLRVVAKGNHIQAYLNGELKLNHYDDTYKTGYTGLWTKSDSVTAFDNFKVSLLD